MSSIFKYIKDFYSRDFSWGYLSLIILLMAAVIYFNYWQGLEKKLTGTDKTWLQNFSNYYLIYLLPFAAAFFCQPIFFKDCAWLKNPWFWIILFVAPAMFSFRVNFNWQIPLIRKHWAMPERTLFLHSINWIVRVFVLLIPVFIIWWIKDRSNQLFYGSQPLKNIQPYIIMLLIMVPLIAIALTQRDFLQMYPKAQLLKNIPMTSWTDKWRYVFFELSYGFDFVSIEFFFRGFLIMSLMSVCGTHCIIPIACFYCSIHLGKPMGEAISSFFGGLLLGIISYNTGSIWGGLLIHLGIAWLMEIGGWFGWLFLKLK